MQRRLFKLASVSALLGMVACTAIAGLDGDFGVADDAGATGEDAQTGVDVNTHADGTISNDGGVDQHVEPVDACSYWKPDATTVSTTEASNTLCSSLFGWDLCWDFHSTESPPSFGWDSLDATAAGATMGVEGGVGQASRSLHVVAPEGAASGTGHSLAIYDWNSGQVGVDLYSVSKGSRVLVSVRFKVIRADRPADILGVGFGGRSLGLRVYPDPCGGPPRVGPSGEDPSAYPGGATISLDSWYLGVITVERSSTNTWSATVAVGGVTVGWRNEPFPPSLPIQLDASVSAGLFNLGSGGGSDVYLDDVLVEQSP